jgi:hypothetical protein
MALANVVGVAIGTVVAASNPVGPDIVEAHVKSIQCGNQIDWLTTWACKGDATISDDLEVLCVGILDSSKTTAL